MLAGPVRAQSTLTPDEYNALVAAVESTPSQPATEAPLVGSFYTITHGESWPPLPSDTLGLNFWSLGGDYYLLDDRDYSYNASWADFEPPPSLTNVGSGGSGGNPYFTPPVYTTNDLWLQINGVTNDATGLIANLTINTPWNDTNLTHDLLFTSDLSQPINWRFLMRCVTTNVIARGICDQTGFFELTQTNGNLTVNTNWTALQLAELLVPPGIPITNVVFTGAIAARGTFAGGNGCGLPIDSGVILSSGPITNAIGPNNDSGTIALNNGSSNLHQASDADLDRLVGDTSNFDAAVLEFYIISTNSFLLQFQYIFASEEYPEFIGPYNDPMAIFVSTNRVGTNWINSITNDIALVPGTDLPVSVNTINGGCAANAFFGTNASSNAQYYVDNHDPDYEPAEGYTNAAPAFNIQYDGMTVLLAVQTLIQANTTNHVKIGIEDYGDQYYDSAVFIAAKTNCP